ncbi:DUF3102 domain-containing protein [uncultured Megasphaera sp.]|uniref:DUF3102 domain-containing protein n=1 Tax=uncultured Megasphaera sp. TaxID=165188 RepID=UPI00266CDBCB|nr:DUF3102 domain-containing protein [uncultured Megasphaera sp.]
MNDIINAESTVQEIRTPENIAVEINTIKKQTQKVMLSASIEIGRRLVEAKSLVPHGSWRDWLEQNVDYSERTAQNLIKLYDQYSDKGMDALFDNNLDVFSDLSYTQAVALLSLPTIDERKEFLEAHDVGSMSTRELQEAIKAQKAAEDEAASLKEELHAEKEKSRKIQNEATLQNGNLRETERKLQEKIEEAEQLQRDLEEATVPAFDPVKENEMQRLREENEKLKKAAGEDADMRHFQGQLAVMQEAFNRILALMAAMEEEDKREKYRRAARKLLTRLEDLI